MKFALAIFAILFAASGGAIGESTDASQPPAAQNDQAKKRAAPARQAKPKAEASFVPGGTAQSFVIPKNTCESGTSIQKLLTDKPPSEKPK
jgi:hypothetical protein